MPPTPSKPRRCTVGTPWLFGFGAFACAGAVVLAAIAAYQRVWIGVAVTTMLFGGSGAALMLTAVTLEGDEDGLTVIRLHKRVRIAWRDIVAAAGDARSLSLRTPELRESVLSYSYWRGADKNRLYLLMREKLLAHGAQVAPGLRGFLRMDEDLSGVLPREGED
ncbi:hypothetical protein [Lysobacter enzymogenes]|uniref:hypothetical protein n=1 Tax=Lysobacter enzymogenes TaxID=69 RepID=UPI001AF43516|nr:hypothetical protein [Lysobacter enzymogenes]QQQ01183.1 hypothetical protein JHW41_24555 [Lysobacter enzymogenes]